MVATPCLYCFIGGDTPAAAFFAANSTHLPGALQQQHFAQDAEAEDASRESGRMAPRDVWLDDSAMSHIQGSLPADMPEHERTTPCM